MGLSRDGDAGFDEVIERARGREPQAWADIYERFADRIFGFFVNQTHSRQTAEDLTAGVFVEALQAAEKFQGSVSDLRSWLFRIARNNLIDHVRSAKRVKTEAIEDVAEADLTRLSAAGDPQDLAMAGLDRGAILAAVEKLSPGQREVVLLRLTGDLAYAEIGKLIGKTQGAVKVLHHRAMAALANSLELHVSEPS
jgi:RNA polymerase sigma-70 factor (ECF subfamily)